MGQQSLKKEQQQTSLQYIISHHKLVNFLLYCFSCVCFGMTITCLGPMFPYLAFQQNRQQTEYSFLFTCRALGFVIGALSVKLIQNKFTLHHLLAIGVCLMGTFSILFYFPSSLAMKGLCQGCTARLRPSKNFMSVFYGLCNSVLYALLLIIPQQFGYKVTIKDTTNFVIWASLGQGCLAVGVGKMMGWFSYNWLIYGMCLIDFAIFILTRININIITKQKQKISQECLLQKSQKNKHIINQYIQLREIGK